MSSEDIKKQWGEHWRQYCTSRSQAILDRRHLGLPGARRQRALLEPLELLTGLGEQDFKNEDFYHVCELMQKYLNFPMSPKEFETLKESERQTKARKKS